MNKSVNPDYILVVNQVSTLSAKLWQESQDVVGINTDPKMFSIMLFRRLWGNYREFLSLWKSHLQTEADIILRSGLECAICLAANHMIKEQFVAMARNDAVETLKRQIKIWREDGSDGMVRLNEAILRDLSKQVSSEARPKAFDWGELARLGEVPHLYRFYRVLSGNSSHVTGASLLKGVVGSNMEGKDQQEQTMADSRTLGILMMTHTMLISCKKHATMIGSIDSEIIADRLSVDLNKFSFSEAN